MNIADTLQIPVAAVLGFGSFVFVLLSIFDLRAGPWRPARKRFDWGSGLVGLFFLIVGIVVYVVLPMVGSWKLAETKAAYATQLAAARDTIRAVTREAGQMRDTLTILRVHLAARDSVVHAFQAASIVSDPHFVALIAQYDPTPIVCDERYWSRHERQEKHLKAIEDSAGARGALKPAHVLTIAQERDALQERFSECARVARERHRRSIAASFIPAAEPDRVAEQPEQR